ncbi:MAG TPA: sigma-70 family RNA polymerase sigma factor [Clostridia bacterium]|nr:sigma-70 family RNA polymerase sigma factor [Clostridia bacterium]
METNDLVKKACAGDKEAMISLVMAKKDEYYRLAYTYLLNSHDSMDAMQDMIVLLFKYIGSLKKHDAFYSWSKTILVNCCRNILRKQKKIVPLEHDSQEQYIENYQSKEQKIDIEEHIKRLNVNQQEVLKLRYYMGMDYESIAKLTKVPLGTVKSRISKGLDKLKVVFGGEY